ncbi:MAG: phage tail protein I, partial [Chloroflexi bacterium]|nr:phage tail protein I [Chloroflexota bacterium]
QMVSRRHAQIECTDEGCTITDLDSSNGTKLNGARLRAKDSVPLNPGDMVDIGTFTLTYEQVQIEPEPVVPEEPPAAELESAQKVEDVAAAVEPEPDPKPEAVAKQKTPKAKSKPETDLLVEVEKPEKVAPPPPPPNGTAAAAEEPDAPYTPPPGLSFIESRYIQYLPGIYRTDFMKRFLALFESIYGPIEWNVENFDLYLNPKTAPEGFIPWLANWFDVSFDNSWNEAARRAFLVDAHKIFARRGTKWALSRILEIYTGQEPLIDDTHEDLTPFTFTVEIPLKESEVNRTLIEQLLNDHKPAYTSYDLSFK